MATEEFHKRAIEDFSQYSQNLRMCAQAIFAANGAAALAMLSSLTNLLTTNAIHGGVSLEHVQGFFAISVAFYLLGVSFVTSSLFFLSLAKLLWGSVWEMRATNPNVDHEMASGNRARRYERVAFFTLIASGFAFFVGSSLAIAGFAL